MKSNMSMIDIFKISFKFSLLNKRAILVMGCLLVLYGFSTSILENSHKLIFLVPLLIGETLLYICLVGLLAYFVEEVISDWRNPPAHNFKLTFKKGCREVIFFTLYTGIYMLAVYIFGMVASFLPDYAEIINHIKILAISILGLLPMTAMVNVFLNDEKVIYGFKIDQIINLILNLETSKFIWIVILVLITEKLVFREFTFLSGVIYVDIINLVLNLVVIPFLYIFMQFVKTIAILLSNDNPYREKLLENKSSN